MLRQTGIVRPIDNLGRLVIPREIRKTLDIEDGNDCVEILIDDEVGLVIRKYQPCCVFCNSMTDIVDYDGKLVCSECIDRLNVLKAKIKPME